NGRTRFLAPSGLDEIVRTRGFKVSTHLPRPTLIVAEDCESIGGQRQISGPLVGPRTPYDENIGSDIGGPADFGRHRSIRRWELGGCRLRSCSEDPERRHWFE